MSEKTIAQAVTEALDYKLKTDEKTLIFGEDVGVNGGVFRITDGLQAKYGDKRVLDTPLAESGILGLAIGLFILDTLLIRLFYTSFGLHLLLSKVIVGLLLFVVSWLIQKKIIFKERTAPTHEIL